MATILFVSIKSKLDKIESGLQFSRPIFGEVFVWCIDSFT